MNNLTAVPYLFYENKAGDTISAFTSYVPHGYTLVARGFTVYNDKTNTYGCGRKPFATKKEASAFINKFK